MKKIKIFFFYMVYTSLLTVVSHSQGSNAFKKWPKGTSPEEIGRRVSGRFIATPHTNFNRPTPPRVITYPETCTWYGALTFARQTGDKKLLGQLADRFEPLFGTHCLSAIYLPNFKYFSSFVCIYNSNGTAPNTE